MDMTFVNKRTVQTLQYRATETRVNKVHVSDVVLILQLNLTLCFRRPRPATSRFGRDVARRRISAPQLKFYGVSTLTINRTYGRPSGRQKSSTRVYDRATAGRTDASPDAASASKQHIRRLTGHNRKNITTSRPDACAYSVLVCVGPHLGQALPPAPPIALLTRVTWNQMGRPVAVSREIPNGSRVRFSRRVILDDFAVELFPRRTVHRPRRQPFSVSLWFFFYFPPSRQTAGGVCFVRGPWMRRRPTVN
ncbi:hypothetical protein EVAR_58171_1 [Eumeta japonica]|uniref:Uncharacterized protein n=1 Tax=Eumeta variegata TaxID=151549 RepID=A0A4C1X1A2_EUMVA|nr:hypothetical protein EVAR_58171_1 [Eumeta japonica]